MDGERSIFPPKVGQCPNDPKRASPLSKSAVFRRCGIFCFFAHEAALICHFSLIAHRVQSYRIPSQQAYDLRRLDFEVQWARMRFSFRRAREVNFPGARNSVARKGVALFRCHVSRFPRSPESSNLKIFVECGLPFSEFYGWHRDFLGARGMNFSRAPETR